VTQTEPERAGTASLLFRGIQVKKRDDFFFSVFERAFVEWEDMTLSLDVNIQILQTDPHTFP